MAGLAEYRARIDELDEQIVRALADRFDAVRQVARLKKVEGLAVVQPAREMDVRERYRTAASAMGLDASFGDDLVSLLLSQAYAIESTIFGPKQDLNMGVSR